MTEFFAAELAAAIGQHFSARPESEPTWLTVVRWAYKPVPGSDELIDFAVGVANGDPVGGWENGVNRHVDAAYDATVGTAKDAKYHWEAGWDDIGQGNYKRGWAHLAVAQADAAELYFTVEGAGEALPALRTSFAEMRAGFAEWRAARASTGRFITLSEAELAAVRGGARGPRLGPNWRARSIDDPLTQTGCEQAALQIQKHVGGTIHTITPMEGRWLGAYRGKSFEWYFHDVVVKDGRVYDAFTGSEGATIEEFKALWRDADAIDFTF